MRQIFAIVLLDILPVLTGSKPIVSKHSITVYATNDVVVTSPGYEHGAYPLRTDVFWDIQAHDKQQLQLVFDDFDVEYQGQCQWDYVTVHEKPCNHVTEPRGTKPYCGAVKPFTFISTSYEVCLVFRSDEVVQKKGFKATVRLINNVSSSLLKSTTSNIPSISTSSLTSKTEAATSSPVSTLQLNPSILPESSSTLKDLALTVLHTASTSTSPDSSSTTPTTTTSPLETGTTLSFLPHSTQTTKSSSSSTTADTLDEHAASVNLTMCESALTSYNLNDMVGMMYLKSPTEGTGKYPLNKHCEVTLTNAQMKEVSIEFLTFAVEYQSQCNWDYVQMTIRGDFVRKLCGLDKPKSIKTTSDQIDVIFHSDYVVPADGFVIKIYALPKTTPSAVSTFTNKNLPSMSSTPQLGEPATAVTQSMSPSTTTKSLESTSVFTPQTSSVAMASDALSLLSQKTTSTSTSLSSTSSSKAHYYSTSDTSSSQTSSVTSVETAKPTSFNPTSPSVTQRYDSSTDETSLADKTSSIKNISEGATVSTKRNPDAPPFTTPGNPDVPPLTTPGNQDVPPLAEKTTGTSTKTPGKIVDICHYSHLQIQDSLFLVSPGYTEKQAYPLNTECNVEIVPPPHKEVKLSISDFELELNQECTWDYLTLEQSNIAVRFCGWLDKGHSIGSYDACAPSYIRTVNDKNKRMVCLLNTKTDLKLNEALPIRLKFFSDGFITRRGFNISVELSDATVQTPINGSPSSTQSHTIQQNYTTTSQNTSSNIAVSSISVSAYAKSSYTSLKPISTAKSTATSIPTVNTYVNNQTTIFVTGIESKTPGTGSLTSPVENTATNTLTTDNAPSASTSSTYTEMSKSDSTAEPSTTASVSSRSTSVKPTTVQTTILSTLLKASSTVSSSVSALPQSVPTHSTASVTLPSSMSSTNPISASGNSCSEFEHALVLKESAGIITSPEFKNSKTYAPNSNCSWIISAGANKMIAIVFEHFDIEFDSHCKYDRLTVYRLGLDGVPAEQLAVLCGSNLPPSLHATGEVLVSFQSDGIVQKSGFQLRYLKTSVTSGGVCPGGRTGCGDGGECIPMEWWCDGTTDCANMADENDCPTCSTGEFSCSDGKCLPNSHRCDGISQCAFNEDETGCVTLSDDTHGTLAVNIAGEDHSVCYDVTVQTGSDLLCKKLGYRQSESVLPIKQSDKQQKYARLTLTGTEIVFEKRASCANDMSTLLVCMDSGCGQKADKHRKKRVVGGSVSSTGQWPWIIGLRVGSGIVNCGGTIISRHWVLTAGHCVKDFLFSPQELSIVAGSHDLSDVTGQVRHVAEVIIHPDYNFIYSDDIALLRLQRPLDFSDDVNAACLPWDGRQFSPSSNCYVVGYGVWNVENYYTTLAPRYLRHVRTKIVHSDTCTELYSYKTYIKDTMMCAGYTGGGMDACKGDSGSGLLCETEAGRWMVAGVVSWGDMCGKTNRPGVYTRVTSFLEWIDGQTSVQVNNNSVNCTFEAGWCGYTDSSQGSYFWTRGPWDKYTNGMVLHAVKPSYVKSKSTSAVLESPEFIQSTNSCLKFSFKLSGNSNITLSVFGVIDDNDVNEGVIHKRLLWRVITHYSSSKMWTPTEVDVGSDVRRLHFTSYYDEGNVYSIGLDNVTIVPGPCLGNAYLTCDFNAGGSCGYVEWTDGYAVPWTKQPKEGDESDKFILAGGNPSSFGFMALSQLTTPPLSSLFTTLPHCVIFDIKKFHNSSANIVLATYVAIGGTLNNQNIYWSSKVTSFDWTTVRMTVQPQNLNEFYDRIGFEMRRQQYSSDDVRFGLDNIRIVDGICV